MNWTAALEWIKARWWPGWIVAAVLALFAFRGHPVSDTPQPIIRVVAAPSVAATAHARGGEVTIPTPNGPVIVKCPDLDLSQTATATAEIEYRDLLIKAEKPRWQVGAGGGVGPSGYTYYARVGYRLIGPLGIDLIGLWPPGAMAGINVAW